MIAEAAEALAMIASILVTPLPSIPRTGPSAEVFSGPFVGLSGGPVILVAHACPTSMASPWLDNGSYGWRGLGIGVEVAS